MNNRVRNALRRLGVGKLALRSRQLFSLAFVWRCKFLVARAYHLKSIRKAKPILVAEGDAEVHLLLSHKRIYEALWAVYSFVMASQRSCRVVIHDDGSLTTYDRQLLDSVLSGVAIISRPESDEAAHAFFAKNLLEHWLEHSAFWTSRGVGNYYAELTLWAMLATRFVLLNHRILSLGTTVEEDTGPAFFIRAAYRF